MPVFARTHENPWSHISFSEVTRRSLFQPRCFRDFPTNSWHHSSDIEEFSHTFIQIILPEWDACYIVVGLGTIRGWGKNGNKVESEWNRGLDSREGICGMEKRILLTLILPDGEDWSWLPDELNLNRRLSAVVVPPFRRASSDLLTSVVATYREIGVRFPEDCH